MFDLRGWRKHGNNTTWTECCPNRNLDSVLTVIGTMSSRLRGICNAKMRIWILIHKLCTKSTRSIWNDVADYKTWVVLLSVLLGEEVVGHLVSHSPKTNEAGGARPNKTSAGGLQTSQSGPHALSADTKMGPGGRTRSEPHMLVMFVRTMFKTSKYPYALLLNIFWLLSYRSPPHLPLSDSPFCSFHLSSIWVVARVERTM